MKMSKPKIIKGERTRRPTGRSDEDRQRGVGKDGGGDGRPRDSALSRGGHRPQPVRETRPVSQNDKSVATEGCVEGVERAHSLGSLPSNQPTGLEGVEERKVRYTKKERESVTACHLCSQDFVKLNALHGHTTGRHPKYRVEYFCSDCDYVSERPHGLLCHAPKCKSRAVRAPRVLGFPCEACERSFASARSRSQHERHAHPRVRNAKRVPPELEFPCDVCERSFASQRGLSLHRGYKHPQWVPLAAEFPCEACEKSYATRGGLSAHQRYKHPRADDAERAELEGEDGGTRPPDEDPQHDRREEPAEVDSRVEDPPSEDGIQDGQGADDQTDDVDLHPRVDTGDSPVFDLGKYAEFLEDARSRIGDSQIGVANLLMLGEVIAGTRSPSDDELTLGLYELMSSVRKLGKLTTAKKRQGGSKGDHAIRPTGAGDGRRPGGRSRRAAKRATYGRIQHLYKKNPKHVAQELLDGQTSQKCSIEPEVVESAYRERFSRKSVEVDLSAYPPPDTLADNSTILNPISGEEILASVRRTNIKSAPGEDSISMTDLVGLAQYDAHLAIAFNLWFLVGRQPSGIKQNRSILIPKKTTGLHDLKNWRPLTLSSVVARLYSKVLATRLTESTFICPRQRGFITGASTTENIWVAKKLVTHSKAQRKELNFVLLDLAKAFDTISHRHIEAALRRHAVADAFVRVVMDMYSDASTFFQLSAGDTCRIPINSGVKQGDSLSPHLFNLAMDPIFTLLETSGVGYDVGEFSLCSLAYADDTALVSSSRDGMSRNLSMVVDFLAICGLSLNVQKSCGFRITPCRDSYVVNRGDAYKVGADLVPWLTVGDTTNYLGARIGPWTDTWPSISHVSQKLKAWCNNISTAPLKPRQKVTILSGYAIPRLEYDLREGGYSRTALATLDGVVRFFVKKWYHLPDSVTSHFLYTRTRDGGCGIQCLADSIPALRVKASSKVGESTDEVIRGIYATVSNLGVERTNRGAEPTPLPAPPQPGKQVHWRERHLRMWERLGPQSRGTDCYRNPVTNRWLRGSSFLSEREFLCALKLRSNTLPTKETLSRGRRGRCVLCRRCRSTVETTGHISGACVHVLTERIRRHRRVCDQLIKAAVSKGLRVTDEPAVWDPGGRRLCPDLILRGEDTCYIVDPTVVWDKDMTRLEDAYDVKVRKYQGIVPAVKSLYGVSKVEVHGFVIGARGTYCPRNDPIAQILALNDRRVQAVCQLVLCDTIKIVQKFFDL